MLEVLNISENLNKLRGEIPYKTFRKRQLGLAMPTFLPLEKLPGYVVASFLLTEDALFFRHKGLNLRAFWHRQLLLLRGESGVGSGSSITQQVMKLAFFGVKRGVFAKLFEIYYARCAERIFSKDEILGLYLNAVRFARKSLGISQGAMRYFGKTPEALALTEGVFLAYVIRAPVAVEDSLSKQEHFSRFESFVRVKLFDVCAFYVHSFGIDSLFTFERYSYSDIKTAFGRYSPSDARRSLSESMFAEVEWFVLDQLRIFRDWFFTFEWQHGFKGTLMNEINVERAAAPLSV